MFSFKKFFLEVENYDVIAIRDAILKNPYDETEWLIYADYSEEKENPKLAQMLRFVAQLVKARTEEDILKVIYFLGKRVVGDAFWVKYPITLENVNLFIERMNQLIPFFSQWLERRPLIEKVLRPDLSEEVLVRILPHGSGINYRWYIDEENDIFICRNAFRVENEHGYDVGTVDFTVHIPKNNPLDFTLEIETDQYDLEDEIHQRIYYSLREHYR